MQSSMPPGAAANPTQHNINAIAMLEHDALERRNLTERVSEVITKFVGNTVFLEVQLILIFWLDTGKSARDPGGCRI